MQNIKTMAIKITPDTYPIAVACLPAPFATIGQDSVMGNYLVINAISTTADENEQSLKLSLDNFWVTEELFNEEYDFVGPERKTLFTEVIKLRDAQPQHLEPTVTYRKLPGQRVPRRGRYGANRFAD